MHAEKAYRLRPQMIKAVEARDADAFVSLLREDKKLEVYKSVLTHFTLSKRNMDAVRFILAAGGIKDTLAVQGPVKDVFLKAAVMRNTQPALVRELYKYINSDPGVATQGLQHIFARVACSSEVPLPNAVIARFLIENGADVRAIAAAQKSGLEAEKKAVDLRLERVRVFKSYLSR